MTSSAAAADSMGRPGDSPYKRKSPAYASAAKHEAGNAFTANESTGPEMSTEETSDALSSMSTASRSEDGQYEVIEYDLHDPEKTLLNDLSISFTNIDTKPKEEMKNMLGDVDEDEGGDGDDDELMLSLPNLDFIIEDNSPAAEALRANANVHVSSVGKAARKLHMQSIRRAAKRAAGANKTGYVKGKPPRLPPATHRESDRRNPMTIPEDNDYTAYDDDEDDGEFAEDKTEDKSNNAEIKLEDRKIDISERSEKEEDVLKQLPSRSHEDERIIKQTHSEERIPVSDTAHIPDGVSPGTVEAGKKVLGNVDPHDLLKLQRWRKKKSGSFNSTKSYVKGKVIDGEHELYTLSIAVMIGVRTSISRTNTELNRGPGKRWVRIQDFRTTEKYEFRPKGDGKTPPHLLAHTFKFKDYSPLVFAYLRRMYGVNEFDFLLSVCGNANFIEFISNAKSGQFFFYSSDGKYMIKTMTNAESKFLRRILPQYFKHCCENPNTMMTRFFGMYRVKLYHLRRNVKFVIMNSVYYTEKQLQSFFDLKGSVLGREAKPGQAVLKDNDLRKSLPEGALALKPEQRKNVGSQIASDVEFLQSMEIMDYSMLVGVHYIPPAEERAKAKYRAAGNSNRLRMSLNNGGRGDQINKSQTSDCVPGLSTPTDQIIQSKSDPLHKSSGHRRSVSASYRNFSFDDGLDDDESSYLMGSKLRTNNDDLITSTNEDTERKKLATIEKLYWPFHHWFDIHGYRRLQPARCPTCGDAPCSCKNADSKILQGYNIPKFVPPNSDRKDGGLEMDTTGLQLPLVVKLPSGEKHCEGKIFYMGIIDILQEYTARKTIESRYRSFFTRRNEASCVPPADYAHRFSEFFQEYTTRILPSDQKEEGVEVPKPRPRIFDY